MLYYLAYGSNLHPQRLLQRVPSAEVIGTVEMTGCTLSFSKRSKYGSGKCTIRLPDSPAETDAPVALRARSHTAEPCMYGVLYRFHPSHKRALERAEGTDGYQELLVSCTVDNQPYQAFVYIARASHLDASLKPYRWYKDFVVEGARYHRFPAEYLAWLQAVEAIPDTDPARAANEEALLLKLKTYSIAHGRA